MRLFCLSVALIGVTFASGCSKELRDVKSKTAEAREKLNHLETANKQLKSEIAALRDNPERLMRQAEFFIKVNDFMRASFRLNKVIELHPNSEQGNRAQQMLAEVVEKSRQQVVWIDDDGNKTDANGNNLSNAKTLGGKLSDKDTGSVAGAGDGKGGGRGGKNRQGARAALNRGNN